MSALPALTLEPDVVNSDQFRLVFDPDPAIWVFDDTKGTRAQFREQVVQQIELFKSSAPVDACFDEAAQQTLRTSVRCLLLQWIGFRGLRIPASGGDDHRN